MSDISKLLLIGFANDIAGEFARQLLQISLIQYRRSITGKDRPAGGII
jgi:hypothetical protein